MNQVVTSLHFPLNVFVSFMVSFVLLQDVERKRGGKDQTSFPVTLHWETAIFILLKW